MFREQLHTAFDNISPSPELLDRVSAMMKEEVNKKKAPLRLNVVKYGGIAAALALAAGGTFLVINNQNGGVKTSDSAISESAEKAGADNGRNFAVEENFMGAYSESTEARTTAMGSIAADEAVKADEAEATDAADGAAQDNAVKGETEMFIMSTEAVSAETVSESGNEAVAEEEKNADAADQSFDNGVRSTEEYKKSDSEDDAPVAPAAAKEKEVSVQETATESVSNAATGLLFTDPFLDIRTWSLSIPAQLEDLVDGVRTVNADGEAVYGDKWREYVHAVMRDSRPVTIDGELNIYTFIKYFSIPVEDARKALYDAADTKTGAPNITLTREEADIILTMDVEKITAAFANPYAIVKGTDIYTPAWLLEHSFDDYRAAGITQDDVRKKYGALSTMADTFNDAVIDKDTQAKLNAKLDEFLQ